MGSCAEQLLGLGAGGTFSSLLTPEQDPLASSPSDRPSKTPSASDENAEAMPLPRYLFTFGLSPSGPASAEMLMSLFHHEGTKSVDARLKECGVNSLGSRLKITTAVKRALDSSSAVPPPPRNMPKPVAVHAGGVIVLTGDVASIKGPSAQDIVQEIAGRVSCDVDALVTLAAQGDRDVLVTELRRLGFKTGARLKLEQALPIVANERAARESERVVEAAREAALQQHKEEHRVEARKAREAAMAAEEARAAAEEARVEALYEQYEQEMMEAAEREAVEEVGETSSEVEKLKQARRTAAAAKRQQQEDGDRCKAATTAEAILTDATESDGGVQGLGWRVEGLHVDDEGDEADEFIELH
mmetsp:Transcript_70866/g.117738  ORF Transcript_70866/g.117738 Transcript_70866/m.117738 type:complete len:358 (+) Transcript_70866:76-1149(+)